MDKQQSFAAWIFEMLAEAAGTAVTMIVVSQGAFDVNFSKLTEYVGTFFLLSFFVLICFGVTGYVVTTLLAALYVPRGRWYLYPLISSGLYVMHSSPLLYLVPTGGGKRNIPLQVGGVCSTFLVTLAGDRLRQSKWDE